MPDQSKDTAAKSQRRFLGSLKDALAAASRDEGKRLELAPPLAPTERRLLPPESAQPIISQTVEEAQVMAENPTPESDRTQPPAAPPPVPPLSAADAAREARGGTPNVPPVVPAEAGDTHPPTTRVVREQRTPNVGDNLDETAIDNAEPRTKLVRGRQPLDRGAFEQDPVVGWLVIVGGPGIGSFRPIFEGNNTIGRSGANRIPIDFGDDAVSGREQAYIRYDSADRSFLFIPNLTKTNVVSVNDTRPTGAVALQGMDVITMGRTQLVFVPFCGPEFDWGELPGLKG